MRVAAAQHCGAAWWGEGSGSWQLLTVPTTGSRLAHFQPIRTGIFRACLLVLGPLENEHSLSSVTWPLAFPSEQRGSNTQSPSCCPADQMNAWMGYDGEENIEISGTTRTLQKAHGGVGDSRRPSRLRKGRKREWQGKC